MDIVFGRQKEDTTNLEKKSENNILKNDAKKQEKEGNLKINLNENIQSITSILFTIIIFIALILLIFVLYNNYIKKEKEVVCKKEEVCTEYIKKDYKIKEESIKNYLFKIRGVIYNINDFNIKKITNANYLDFATYFIWNTESDYLICDNTVDNNCLITKKEITKNELNNYFKEYLNLNEIKITFNKEFTNEDKIRIYENDDKVILTFSEFEYETLKHDIVDIRIDEDKIYVIFALSKKIDASENYMYVGYKNLELKYQNKTFIIQNIKTSLNQN